MKGFRRIMKSGAMITAAIILTGLNAPVQGERISLSHLLERIEALETAVDALADTFPPAMVSPNAAAGWILAQSDFEDCIVDGGIIACSSKSTVLISVPAGAHAVTSFVTLGSPPVVGYLELENVAHGGPVGRKIVGKIHIEGKEYSFELLPERPVANTRYDTDYTGDTDIRMALITDSLVAFTIDRAEVKAIIHGSIGIIVDAWVSPYASDARQAQVEVEISNVDDYPSNYLVSVSDCSDNIEPGVPTQIVWMEPIPTNKEKLVLDVKTDSSFAADNKCTVYLISPTGRLNDRTTVIFPDPS